MGIENIDILKPDDDSLATQIREKKVAVSQHIVLHSHTDRRYMFGWDQPLQSFYLQVHDMTKPKDDRIITWLGATPETEMYEVEHLVQAAREHGLDIPHETQVKLYGEKDDGV